MRTKLAIIGIGLICLKNVAGSPEWTRSAMRLTGAGEPDQKKALQILKSIPNLAEVMLSELGGENRFLALDVITNLHLKKMLPVLIEISVRDTTGFVYNAINAFLDHTTNKMIGDLYAERLSLVKSFSIAPTPQVIMLDTLGRLGRRIDEETLWQLVRSSSIEVRSAALYYIRARCVKRKNSPPFEMIEELLKSPYYQIRIQAIFVLSELLTMHQPKSKNLLRLCLEDSHKEVREICKRVINL